MRRRTWAAVLATAVLAALPVGAAAGSDSLPDPGPLGVAPEWVVRGTDEVRIVLDVDASELEGADVVVEVEVGGRPAVPARVDEGGSVLRASLPLEEDVACGRVPLYAVARATDGEESWYLGDGLGELHVLCPALSVTPDRLPASAPGTPLVWEVTGFVPDSVVALRLGDQPVQVVETDKAGEARYTAPAPQLACGVVPARAIDRSEPEVRKEREIPADLVVEALDRVRVDCPDRPQPEPPVVPAVVQVNPAVVHTGTTTRVTGQQFPPGTPVSLSWLLPGGRTLPAGTTTADAAGSIRVDLLVLAHSGTGTRQLLAGSGAAVATDQLLVVGGTTQPGRQGLVNRR